MKLKFGTVVPQVLKRWNTFGFKKFLKNFCCYNTNELTCTLFLDFINFVPRRKTIKNNKYSRVGTRSTLKYENFELDGTIQEKWILIDKTIGI